MTSDEIRNAKDLNPQYWWIWLQECAVQLAVMNERNARKDQEDLDWFKARGVLGSTVPPDPESALREDRWRGKICRRGFHRFEGIARDDSRCLNCGWTSGDIFTAQHAENLLSQASLPGCPTCGSPLRIYIAHDPVEQAVVSCVSKGCRWSWSGQAFDATRKADERTTPPNPQNTYLQS